MEKRQAPRDAHRRVHRVLVPGEEAAHLGFRLEVRFGVRRGGEAERVHGGAEADRRQHVGQAPPVRVVEAHAARGEQRGAGRARHRRQEVQPLAVVAAEAVVGGAEQGRARRRRSAAASRAKRAAKASSGALGRQQRHHQPVRVLDQVVAGDAALALGRLHPALSRAAARACRRRRGRWARRGTRTPSGKRTRAPGTKRTFASFAATCPRTSPAKELRSAMPTAAWPSAFAAPPTRAGARRLRGR
jgi:hypothetical protein